jgi:hypothetical protein
MRKKLSGFPKTQKIQKKFSNGVTPHIAPPRTGGREEGGYIGGGDTGEGQQLCTTTPPPLSVQSTQRNCFHDCFHVYVIRGWR